MHKYSSSSRFHIQDTLLTILMFVPLAFIGVTTTSNIAAQISVTMVTLLMAAWFILRLRDKVIDVEFTNEYVTVEHVFKSCKERFPYEKIISLEYVSVRRSPTLNKIEFYQEDERRLIQFKSVAYGAEFIDFVKWLKSKNEKVIVSVYPPDHYMNHRLQEEYGFNYRKVPKID